MTQVKDITDQQLNRALAELMGYTVSNDQPEWWRIGEYWELKEPTEERQRIGRYTEEEVWEDAPDYCNDPAASLEVQEKAIEVDARKFALCLYVVRVKTKTGVNIKPSEVANWPHLSINIVADLLNASPRERAEAAYITLQGAKGNE